MIKTIIPLVKGRQQAFGSLRKTHTLVKTRLYFFSELPKGSHFATFMGLSKDLEIFRKEEIKKQSSEVRTHSLVLMVALIMLGSGILLLYFDQNMNFAVLKWLAKLKLNIFKAKAQKAKTISVSLKLVADYLSKHPYEYANSLDILLSLVDEITIIKDASLLTAASTQYSLILTRNFRAAEHKLFLQGMKQLTELALLHGGQIQADLVNVLLIHGGIKEVYLAVSYYERIGQGGRTIRENKELLECVQKNMNERVQKDRKYYLEITEDRLKHDYPQLQFKQSCELKWTKYLETTLHLSFT